MQRPDATQKPSEYLKQLYFDSLVFTSEALRHLVNEDGASQIMIGTDYAVRWVKALVDQILNTPGLSDSERIAILGANAAKLMKSPHLSGSNDRRHLPRLRPSDPKAVRCLDRRGMATA